MIKNKVIAINGPPRVGKSTLSGVLTTTASVKYNLNVIVKEFKDDIFKLINLSYLFGEDVHERYEEIKDSDPNLRRVLCNLSEEVIKPIYGRDFWANKLLNNVSNLNDTNSVIIIPDLGFVEELVCLREVFKDNLTTVCLKRDNVTFSNDTRAYLECDLTFENLTLTDNVRTADVILNHALYKKKEYNV